VLSEKKLPGVKLDFFPQDATAIRYAVIQKFTVEPDEILESLEQKYMVLPEEKKVAFYDIVDNLFGATDKVILRSERGIRLMQEGDILTFRQLSSGEKQMLLILLTVLLQHSLPYVLFMDEPEVSLHMEWQKSLIDNILRLNPNIQIILTTHSPAIIMNGWVDKVTEVNDIEVR
jgi:predicted ATP-dependent endonuclease of OLD family